MSAAQELKAWLPSFVSQCRSAVVAVSMTVVPSSPPELPFRRNSSDQAAASGSGRCPERPVIVAITDHSGQPCDQLQILSPGTAKRGCV